MPSCAALQGHTSQCGLTANTFDNPGWQQAARWRHMWRRMAEHTYPRYICGRGSGSPCQRRLACVLWELPRESGVSVWQILGYPALLEFSVAFAGQPVTEVLQKSDRKATGGWMSWRPLGLSSMGDRAGGPEEVVAEHVREAMRPGHRCLVGRWCQAGEQSLLELCGPTTVSNTCVNKMEPGHKHGVCCTSH